MHAVVLELDEGQDYPQPGFTEIIETMKTASEGSQWRIHGVSSGRRDFFYRATMNEFPNMRFKVHKYAAMYRETWCDAERTAKIDLYGGEDNIDYRRNVYGHHGEARSALFSLSTLTACVARERTSWEIEYNKNVYSKVVVSEHMAEQFAKEDNGESTAIRRFVESAIPAAHLEDQYVSYFGGADVGMLHDPTEILIWGQYRDSDGVDKFRHLLRVKLVRVTTADQAAVVAAIFDMYGDRMRAFGMDRNGIGLGLFQFLSADRAASALTAEQRRRIKGYTATQKVPVGFTPSDEDPGADAADLVIKQDVTSWGFTKLRQLVEGQLIQLPNDEEQLDEWQGQSVITVREPSSGALVRRGGSRVSLHTLDAAILLVAAMELPLLQEIVEESSKQAPVVFPW